MKKLILALACILGTMYANAQLRYGATAGVDITSLKFKQDLFNIEQSVGYEAGVMGELMFPGIGFGLDFGAMYSQRGATLDMGSREVWAASKLGRERVYLHYLEIPFNLRFKWTRMNGLEDYIAPYIFGGPKASFLVGHNNVKGTDGKVFEYAGGDLGLQAGMGFELWKNWQVQASYTWGMTYALKTVKLDNFSARNRTWSVRTVYFF